MSVNFKTLQRDQALTTSFKRIVDADPRRVFLGFYPSPSPGTGTKIRAVSDLSTNGFQVPSGNAWKYEWDIDHQYQLVQTSWEALDPSGTASIVIIETFYLGR